LPASAQVRSLAITSSTSPHLFFREVFPSTPSESATSALFCLPAAGGQKQPGWGVPFTQSRPQAGEGLTPDAATAGSRSGPVSHTLAPLNPILYKGILHCSHNTPGWGRGSRSFSRASATNSALFCSLVFSNSCRISHNRTFSRKHPGCRSPTAIRSGKRSPTRAKLPPYFQSHTATPTKPANSARYGHLGGGRGYPCFLASSFSSLRLRQASVANSRYNRTAMLRTSSCH